MPSVTNERLRTTCGWLNTLATLLAAGGMLAPVLLAFSSVLASPGLILLMSLVWFGTAVMLHLLSCVLLGRLAG